MPQPPLTIDPLTPISAPDGLFAAVGKSGGMLDMPLHGQNQGAVWVPDTTVSGHTYAAPCQAPPYATLTADLMDRLAMAWPFAVYTSIDAAAYGLSDADLRRRVTQRLVNYEQNIVENAFWGPSSLTVFQGVQNYAGALSDGAPAGIAGVTGGVLQQFAAAGVNAGFYDLTGTAVSLQEGVSQLEQSAADHYYGQGFLHARPRLAAYLGFKNQFKFIPVPPIEQTWNEDILVLGNGYAGTGPAGQAPTNTTGAGATEYIWVTGRVIIWRDREVTVNAQPAQLLNKTTNQRIYYAYRQYMIGVEGFAAVINIDRSL